MPLPDQSASVPDPREAAEIMVNGEVVGYGLDGMGAALRKLLADDEDKPAFDEEGQS
jgi:hypothetical protein